MNMMQKYQEEELNIKKRKFKKLEKDKYLKWK